MAAMASLFVGTAGWSVSSRYRGAFPAEGSQLERYAARLGCVEINSSFYRPHRRETYERWAASTPENFRFAVKLPRTITHERRLGDCGPDIDGFVSQVSGLGEKLAVILIQTPPTLRFDAAGTTGFLQAMQDGTQAALALEPRHASWASCEAGDLLERFGIARVAADPPPYRHAEGRPSERLAYFRLHGAPRIYYSDYSAAELERIAGEVELAARHAAQAWCIFDNTAEGHALGNALSLDARLESLNRPAPDLSSASEHV